MKWSESERPRAGGPWGGALRAAAWAWLGVAVALPAAAQIPGAGAGAKDLTLVGALAVCAAFVLLFAVRALWPRGDVAVVIDYPSDQRGAFSVRLSKQRARPRRPTVDAVQAPTGEGDHDGVSSRTEHLMVARETRFSGVAARRWYVVLEGILEEPGPDGARIEVLEEREIVLKRGRTLRVAFDLSPRECTVELRIVERGRPATRARVALGGDPTSLRYARDGVMRWTLDRGEHVLLVGGEDRVAERPIAVDSFEAQAVTIDLHESAELAFEGCPPAVEPYLGGELEVAATALERAGQRDRARLLRASHYQRTGQLETAANHFEAAGRLLEAAELHARIGHPERAAVLFERAGEAYRAAEMHNAAGDLLRAGRAYEESGEYQSAADCYRQAEAIPKLIGALEKQEEYFEAGELAWQRGEQERAVRNFQQVDARHPRYAEACRCLADWYADDEKFDLAVQKAEEVMTRTSTDEAGSPETAVWYGGLLERAGRLERALQILEAVEEKSPDLPGVAERLDVLRDKIAAERNAASGSDSGMGTSAGRYEILGRVGRGGMGVVFKARDRRLGRVVALKRLPDNLKDHPRAVELFLREARSAAALNHPNIVTLHDADQEGGSYFLTMELLEGAPLDRIIKKRGRLSPYDAARLGVQIAQGLDYAHDRGIVHRDIKTANLFFTNGKVLKIMDFGLARLVEEVRKATTLVGGTPYYMAPEQVVGRGVDHRADLYALGVTLFELVTGAVPFKEGDIMYHHRYTAAPDPRERVPNLPDPLAELILQLMAKRPEERIQTAAEVARELNRVANAIKT